MSAIEKGIQEYGNRNVLNDKDLFLYFGLKREK